MHPQCEMCALMKSIHSLLWWQWLSLCLPCNVQSMYPRRVTQRGKKKKKPISVSWLTHQWWEHLAGEQKLSARPRVSFCSATGAGICSIISWNSVITLIVWSAHRHTHKWRQWHITAGDGRIKHDCMQIRGMFVKMNVFVWKKKVPLFKVSMCNPVC